MATQKQWAALRAMLDSDWGRHGELARELAAAHDLDTWGTVVGAAYYLAIRRQFPSGHSSADVIRLAAEVRATFDKTGDEFDGRSIELMIRLALGDTKVEDEVDRMADRTALIAQSLTLALLAADHRLGDPDEFFREVEALATEWGA